MLQRRESLTHKITDLGLLAALYLLALALRPWPMAWRIRLGGCLGRLAGRTSKRRILALNNLKRAFGDDPALDRPALIELLDRSYRDLGRTFIEFLMSSTIHSDYFEAHVVVEGDDRLRGLAAEGRGAVLLTGHFGNWEYLNLMAGVRGYPLAVLARVQKLRRTDAFLNRLRAQKGARIVLRGMDTRALYRILKGGGLVGILADQDGGAKGVFAPLFGRASSYPRGVARFSYATGSPVVPAFVTRTALDRHRIYIGTEIRVIPGEPENDFERRVVAEFSLQLEKMVRRFPDQWVWAHRRWKSSPERDLMVLDDGRKGHVNQSSALATRITEHRSKQVAEGAASPTSSTRVRTVKVHYRSQAARTALTFYGLMTRGRLWGGMTLLKALLVPDSYRQLSTVPADLVISCGSATEAVNLIVARDCLARACYIHKPQFGLKRFTAVLAPDHDRLPRTDQTLVMSGAVSFVDRDLLTALREKARAKAGIGPEDRAVALLVGGPSGLTPWDPAVLEAMFFGLLESARGLKIYLLPTTSRRTDGLTEKVFERAFCKNSLCPVVVIANHDNPKGAYEEILAAADMILVTADSVSMVSEAVSTGKPVGLIMAGSRASAAPKFGRFLDTQIGSGAVIEVNLENLRQFLTRPTPAAMAGDEAVLCRAVEQLAV